MHSFTWPGSDATSDRVAALLPGTGYTVDRPLLYWCAELLVQQGWRVEAVEWTAAEANDSVGASLVEEALELAFSGAAADADRLVVAKSFGAAALPWAVTSGVPGIWLTPVLLDHAVREALAAAPATHLAIGGERDDLWAPAAALGTEATLVTVPDANHRLEVDGDWRASLTRHADVFAHVSAWVATLGKRSA